jgi:hypothetical protein
MATLPGSRLVIISSPYASDRYSGEWCRESTPPTSGTRLRPMPSTDAVVIPGRQALPPISGTVYTAFVDPSGGAQDAMTLAIAHSERQDGHLVAVLDLVAARTPPFSPESVVKEFAKLLNAYSVHYVTGDRYSGEWCREVFARYGIAYMVSEQTKSQLYGEWLPLVTSQRVALLDHPKLVQEAWCWRRRAEQEMWVCWSANASPPSCSPR